MPIEQSPTKRLIRANQRNIWIGALILLVATLIVGAACLAFVFESPSIKYKFGWDKSVLRTGKVVGLTAAVLLLLQLPVAGRFKILDRIFSLPVLYQVHRYSGYLIACLVVLHPMMVFWPEGRLMIPFEARYWPEWVGAGLLVAVLSQVILARWRVRWVPKYPKWLLLHRIMGIAILALLVVHVLYVSETFEHAGLPRNAVMVAAGVTAMLWLAVRAQRIKAKRHPFKVNAVLPAGKDAVAIDLQPIDHQRFQYTPGQFAFFSFLSDQLSPEWHPFTLSSSPTRPDSLQVSIRGSGDWTRHAGKLQPGAQVYVHGPFGRFSHQYEDDRREVIMIAGGIGITPMLSMLRQMSDKGDQRPVTLIWSNQTAQHLFNRDELAEMEQKLTRFTWIPIFTRNKEPLGRFGRLTRERLEELLERSPRDAAIFLCGPPMMIQQIHQDLKAMGFSARSINQELFGL